MKNILNFMFILILTLGLAACSTSNMLKDSLEEGSGWGDTILNQKGVTIDSTLSITSGAIDFAKGEVTIASKTATIGTAINNVQSGSKVISVTIPSVDGKMIYSGTGTVAIQAGVMTEATVKLTVAKSASNAYKIIFDPAVYGKTVVNEVHLVGDLPGANWNPSNLSYSLVKQADGKWVGIFDIEAGKEFKFIYDSTSWNGNDVGNSGSNFVMGDLTNVIESLLAWKFTFDPTVYSVTVATEVHLVGDLPNANWAPEKLNYPLVKQADGKWVGYFDIAEGKEFKFIYDSTSWNSHDIGNSGSNFKVQETSGVVTQSF